MIISPAFSDGWQLKSAIDGFKNYTKYQIDNRNKDPQIKKRTSNSPYVGCVFS